MFSLRTTLALQPNALSLALERARAHGEPVVDLTVSNPTRAGLPYPEPRILAALSGQESLAYAPTPFGLAEARAAVAATYGGAVDPSRIILTASTSEAYAFLFKLLADDGDDMLVPEPSYPLFEILARFEGVRLVPYPLAYDGAWHVDTDAVRSLRGRRTRAVLVVSPNNPTGSYLKHDELVALAALGLPILADEVFAPFSLVPDRAAGSPSRRAPSVALAGVGELVFALGGLSKMAALPQMKLAWIVATGTNDAKVAAALERLELIADAFLSVGTPVQAAAAELLAGSDVTRRAIQARLLQNLDVVRSATRGTPLTVLDVEGGWYATLRLPATETEEAWALLLLEEASVYVHPGHFFDFRDEPYVVVSLLTPESIFEEGIRRLVRCVEGRLGE